MSGTGWDRGLHPLQELDLKKDLEHLRLLSIGFYVGAGLSLVFGLLFTLHVTTGLAMVSGSGPFASVPATSGGFPPEAFGWIFVIVGALSVAFGLALAVLNFFTARSLVAHQRRMLCIVAGAINCIHVPLGTLLGVFTILVLSRPSVRALFEAPGTVQGE